VIVKENRTVVASGYFDPIHVGHIEYLEMAAKLGDKLIVIVNNDNQAALKKGAPFMTEGDRLKIVSSLKCVDEVFLSIDEDPTVCRSLQAVSPDIFAKGGDRFVDEIPEATTCKEIGAEIVDGLGMKIRSSSDYYNKEE
jgi:cytidyltransferase-like protein